MAKTNKIRAGLTAAVLVIGLGAAGTGVAFAATPVAPAAAAQPAPGTGVDSAQMDQTMEAMVANLPADQRAAATRMHEQMRPAMATMMGGDTSGTGAMMGGNPTAGG